MFSKKDQEMYKLKIEKHKKKIEYYLKKLNENTEKEVVYDPDDVYIRSSYIAYQQRRANNHRHSDTMLNSSTEPIVHENPNQENYFYYANGYYYPCDRNYYYAHRQSAPTGGYFHSHYHPQQQDYRGYAQNYQHDNYYYRHRQPNNR